MVLPFQKRNFELLTSVQSARALFTLIHVIIVIVFKFEININVIIIVGGANE